MEKKKFEGLVTGNFVQEAIGEVKEGFDFDVLTERQWERVEKKVLENITTKQTQVIKETLVSGDSVEIKGVANIRPHESTVRKNENGTPVRKLSITTRENMKKDLNQ